MGNIMSWFDGIFGKKDASILLLGLDAAGKTTILVKLKLNELQETIPTVGFNVDMVEYKNIKFHIWDVGGQQKLRNLWQRYFDGANAVIFVIDSCDRDRISVAKEELMKILSSPLLVEASLLILCNKQDLENRLTPAQCVEQLGVRQPGPEGLQQYLHTRQWYVQGCCAHTGDGLYEGLDWLSKHLPDTA